MYKSKCEHHPEVKPEYVKAWTGEDIFIPPEQDVCTEHVPVGKSAVVSTTCGKLYDIPFNVTAAGDAWASGYNIGKQIDEGQVVDPPSNFDPYVWWHACRAALHRRRLTFSSEGNKVVRLV